MALVLKDRVKETTTTTGTGAVVLAGASTGYQSFAAIGDGNTTYYTITDGTTWEVGIGTYTASTTSLSRDTVLESSNNNNLVNFLAGVKDVFVTYPAEKAVTSDQINPFTDPFQINVNSSSAALAISQLGAGNALLIEDSASPDSSPLVVDQFGNLIIGASSRSTPVASKIEVNSTTTETQGLVPSVNLTNWNGLSSAASSLAFRHYRSGSVGTVVDNQSGDALGRVVFWTVSGLSNYAGSISATTASSLTGVNLAYSATSHTFSGPVDVTDLEVTNIKAKDGTAAASIADSTGVITITTQLNVDNLNLSVNTLASTNTNGDITIAPNGTGGVYTQNSNGSALFVRNTTASSSGSSFLTFQNLDGASNYRTVARASGVTDSNGGNGGFLVETAFGVALYKGFFIDKDSNVFFYDTSNNPSLKWNASNKYLGINQNNPTANLDVNGTAKITGSVTLGDASTDSVTVNGTIGVGGIGNASTGILLSPTALTGVFQYGIYSNTTVTSAGTGGGYGVVGQVSTAAASFTTQDAIAIGAFNAVKGTGSTIVNQYGVYIANQSAGTNNFGVASLVSSGANKWNIYASGTAENYFAGTVKIGGTADRATTAGTRHLSIFDGTAPVGTLANGISIYSSSGEAYVMDAAGNATLFSPHDSETNEWIFKSKHTPTGKVLKIDVERLLRFVNDHFGLDAIKEFVEE